MSERHLWADEVEQEEAEDRLRAGDYGGVAADDWHEGIEVERGTARHRLDLSHGFVRHIVHNQKAREAYEQQWQAENVDHPYNAPWSQEPEDRTARESWRSSDASRQDAPSVKPLYDAAAADRWAASEADQRSWWRRPTAAGSGYSMRSGSPAGLTTGQTSPLPGYAAAAAAPDQTGAGTSGQPANRPVLSQMRILRRKAPEGAAAEGAAASAALPSVAAAPGSDRDLPSADAGVAAGRGAAAGFAPLAASAAAVPAQQLAQGSLSQEAASGGRGHVASPQPPLGFAAVPSQAAASASSYAPSAGFQPYVRRFTSPYDYQMLPGAANQPNRAADASTGIDTMPAGRGHHLHAMPLSAMQHTQQMQASPMSASEQLHEATPQAGSWSNSRGGVITISTGPQPAQLDGKGRSMDSMDSMFAQQRQQPGWEQGSGRRFAAEVLTTSPVNPASSHGDAGASPSSATMHTQAHGAYIAGRPASTATPSPDPVAAPGSRSQAAPPRPELVGGGFGTAPTGAAQQQYTGSAAAAADAALPRTAADEPQLARRKPKRDIQLYQVRPLHSLPLDHAVDAGSSSTSTSTAQRVETSLTSTASHAAPARHAGDSLGKPGRKPTVPPQSPAAGSVQSVARPASQPAQQAMAQTAGPRSRQTAPSNGAATGRSSTAGAAQHSSQGQASDAASAQLEAQPVKREPKLRYGFAPYKPPPSLGAAPLLVVEAQQSKPGSVGAQAEKMLQPGQQQANQPTAASALAANSKPEAAKHGSMDRQPGAAKHTSTDRNPEAAKYASTAPATQSHAAQPGLNSSRAKALRKPDAPQQAAFTAVNKPDAPQPAAGAAAKQAHTPTSQRHVTPAGATSQTKGWPAAAEPVGKAVIEEPEGQGHATSGGAAGFARDGTASHGAAAAGSAAAATAGGRGHLRRADSHGGDASAAPTTAGRQGSHGQGGKALTARYSGEDSAGSSGTSGSKRRLQAKSPTAALSEDAAHRAGSFDRSGGRPRPMTQPHQHGSTARTAPATADRSAQIGSGSASQAQPSALPAIRTSQSEASRRGRSVDTRGVDSPASAGQAGSAIARSRAGSLDPPASARSTGQSAASKGAKLAASLTARAASAGMPTPGSKAVAQPSRGTQDGGQAPTTSAAAPAAAQRSSGIKDGRQTPAAAATAAGSEVSPAASGQGARAGQAATKGARLAAKVAARAESAGLQHQAGSPAAAAAAAVQLTAPERPVPPQHAPVQQHAAPQQAAAQQATAQQATAQQPLLPDEPLELPTMPQPPKRRRARADRHDKRPAAHAVPLAPWLGPVPGVLGEPGVLAPAGDEGVPRQTLAAVVAQMPWTARLEEPAGSSWESVQTMRRWGDKKRKAFNWSDEGSQSASKRNSSLGQQHGSWSDMDAGSGQHRQRAQQAAQHGARSDAGQAGSAQRRAASGWSDVEVPGQEMGAESEQRSGDSGWSDVQIGELGPVDVGGQHAHDDAWLAASKSAAAAAEPVADEAPGTPRQAEDALVTAQQPTGSASASAAAAARQTAGNSQAAEPIPSQQATDRSQAAADAATAAQRTAGRSHAGLIEAGARYAQPSPRAGPGSSQPSVVVTWSDDDSPHSTAGTAAPTHAACTAASASAAGPAGTENSAGIEQPTDSAAPPVPLSPTSASTPGTSGRAFLADPAREADPATSLTRGASKRRPEGIAAQGMSLLRGLLQAPHDSGWRAARRMPPTQVLSAHQLERLAALRVRQAAILQRLDHLGAAEPAEGDALSTQHAGQGRWQAQEAGRPPPPAPGIAHVQAAEPAEPAEPDVPSAQHAGQGPLQPREGGRPAPPVSSFAAEAAHPQAESTDQHATVPMGAASGGKRHAPSMPVAGSAAQQGTQPSDGALQVVGTCEAPAAATADRIAVLTERQAPFSQPPAVPQHQTDQPAPQPATAGSSVDAPSVASPQGLVVRASACTDGSVVPAAAPQEPGTAAAASAATRAARLAALKAQQAAFLNQPQRASPPAAPSEAAPSSSHAHAQHAGRAGQSAASRSRAIASSHVPAPLAALKARQEAILQRVANLDGGSRPAKHGEVDGTAPMTTAVASGGKAAHQQSGHWASARQEHPAVCEGQEVEESETDAGCVESEHAGHLPREAGVPWTKARKSHKRGGVRERLKRERIAALRSAEQQGEAAALDAAQPNGSPGQGAAERSANPTGSAVDAVKGRRRRRGGSKQRAASAEGLPRAQRSTAAAVQQQQAQQQAPGEQRGAVPRAFGDREPVAPGRGLGTAGVRQASGTVARDPPGMENGAPKLPGGEGRTRAAPGTAAGKSGPPVVGDGTPAVPGVGEGKRQPRFALYQPPKRSTAANLK